STSLLRLRDPDGKSNIQRPAAEDTATDKLQGSQLQGYDWRHLHQQQQLQQYHESVSDQGHESDPSELLRPPILMSSSPPRNFLRPQDFNQQDVYPVRRTHRSMSLSAPSDVWHDNISARALPSPSSSRDHHEVVPYTQEWRVI
ncbi:hypothetical protein BGZ65_010749, partial [Modicella reniformis]